MSERLWRTYPNINVFIKFLFSRLGALRGNGGRKIIGTRLGWVDDSKGTEPSRHTQVSLSGSGSLYLFQSTAGESFSDDHWKYIDL